jgi:hypothetical protein
MRLYRVVANWRIGVSAKDRCDIDVKVFDGDELVGNTTVHLPQ